MAMIGDPRFLSVRQPKSRLAQIALQNHRSQQLPTESLFHLAFDALFGRGLRSQTHQHRNGQLSSQQLAQQIIPDRSRQQRIAIELDQGSNHLQGRDQKNDETIHES